MACLSLSCLSSLYKQSTMSRGHLNSASYSEFSFSLWDLMVAQGQSVVGVAPGGPGLPVLNWSTKGGDLRVAHFLGIHAIQILPIAGWVINQPEGLSMRGRLTAVVAVSASVVSLMGLVFLQALNGVPLVRM